MTKNKDKNEQLNVAVIIGSTREGRFGDKPALWISDLAKSAGMSVEVLDLRDYDMPFFAEDHSLGHDPKISDPTALKWANKIASKDAYIVVSPEYNHSTSGVLKNAMDYAYSEWNKKPIAFVAYGSVGGARAVEHLRAIAIELQMAPVRQAVHIVAPWFLVDENNQLKAGALEQYTESAKTMLEQLIWWGNALKNAR